jgi:oligopeptidase A
MEYWLFQTPFLSDLARHCETGESIPNEIIQKLKQRNQSTKCNELLIRLFLGKLELEVNSNFDPQGDESIIALQRKYAERYCPKQIPPKGNIDPLIQIFESNATGKCSVQYRYLWSEVMSADIFHPFQEVVENGDEAALRELGNKFRKSFLEQGGSVSTEEAFLKFRGRKASTEALLELYGLK